MSDTAKIDPIETFRTLPPLVQVFALLVFLGGPAAFIAMFPWETKADAKTVHDALEKRIDDLGVALPAAVVDEIERRATKGKRR